ncbi:MAG: hypothetical protein ACR2HN_05510 [Tepidiformaceae bacterium]
MKVLLFATLLFLAALIVLAVVFRSRAARDMLRFGRNLLFAYVAMIVVLGAIEFWRRGL